MSQAIRIICSICLLMNVCLLPSSSTSDNSKSSNSYTVLCVYEELELSGAKALDTFSNLEEKKALFIPTKLDTGKYTVDVTRIVGDFYQICGTDQYFETQYFHEYTIREEVILYIKSNYVQNVAKSYSFTNLV